MINFCITEGVVLKDTLLCFNTSINYTFEDMWRGFNKAKHIPDETFLLAVDFVVLSESQTRNAKS
jgi:hypothetical protein